MGSGVVGFNVEPERAVFADVNPHIINFYNRIKAVSYTHLDVYKRQAVAMLREKNPTATIVTTAWDALTGEQILKAMSTKRCV